MGRPRVSDGTPLAIRLDATTRARLEELRTTLAPGVVLTLAQVVRAVLARGLEAGAFPSRDGGFPTPDGQASPNAQQRRTPRK